VSTRPPLAVFQQKQFGKYQLIAKLAQGGMAEIYLAVENAAYGARRFVIVKRMRPAFEGDSDYIDFFITEGRVALKVAHPNLPQSFELGRVDTGYYLAMEYIRGPSLLELLRAAGRKGRILNLRTIMTVAMSVAAALDHVHGLSDVDGRPMRVVHRDVTPQNVLVGFDGTVKLIDFGIAQASIQAHRTAAGVVKGKFSYLSPEQINRRELLDHRADLFSLGIVMHEALSGRSLFRARSDRETVDRVLSGDIPLPSTIRDDVPQALDEVVMRALARDPNRRYQRAYDVLLDLEHVADEHNLHPSTIRLRDEVNTLCGPPQEHRVATVTEIELSSQARALADTALLDPSEVSRARSAPPEAGQSVANPDGANEGDGFRASGRGNSFEEKKTVHSPPPLFGMAADHDLMYFLRKSGASMPARRRSIRAETRSDVAFSQLVATIDQQS